jgi:threonine/homoserine/homoserine lactone efflux protein
MSNALLALSPLVVMMFVASITPGPNNLMLMIAGTRFGFLQTLPHLAGVICGTALIICIACAGLSSVLQSHALLLNVMTAVSSLYLLWMATRLLGIGKPRKGTSAAAVARPMRFHEAVLFQFVNPKVWTMAVAAASIAARFPYPPALSVGLVALVIVVINSPCIAVWAAGGKMLRRHLEHAPTRRLFDGAMAVLVIGTAAWISWPLLGLG